MRDLTEREYKYGFVADIEVETITPGLNEDAIRLISAKKKGRTAPMRAEQQQRAEVVELITHDRA